MTQIASCPDCSYPISAPPVNDQISCPMCHTISQSISDVVIPTGLFWGIIGLGVGVLVGPALIASTESGAQWMKRKAQEKLS